MDHRQYQKQGHEHDLVRHRVEEDARCIPDLQLPGGKSIEPVRHASYQDEAKRFLELATQQEPRQNGRRK